MRVKPKLASLYRFGYLVSERPVLNWPKLKCRSLNANCLLPNCAWQQQSEKLGGAGNALVWMLIWRVSN